MQPEKIKALIEEMVLAGFGYQLSLWIVAVVAAGVASYLGAYLGKKAEAKASREEFSTLLEQLRVTTKETEAIKQLLSGEAWRSQKQWEAREKYYGDLLSRLHAFRLTLEELSDYFIEPGSEHVPDNFHGAEFTNLKASAWDSYMEVKKLVGVAVIFLSRSTIECIDVLVKDHWNLANFGSVCTADYVKSAHKLVCEAFDQVVLEAEKQLGIGGK